MVYFPKPQSSVINTAEPILESQELNTKKSYSFLRTHLDLINIALSIKIFNAEIEYMGIDSLPIEEQTSKGPPCGRSVKPVQHLLQ